MPPRTSGFAFMATTFALLGATGKRDHSASSRTASRIANASAAAIGSVRRGAACSAISANNRENHENHTGVPRKPLYVRAKPITT